MITSVMRPLVPSLVVISSAGTCSYIGEAVIPAGRVYFFTFYFLTFLLTCPDRIVRRMETSLTARKTCFREF